MVNIENSEHGFIETFTAGTIQTASFDYDGNCILKFGDGREKCLEIPCSSFNRQYGIVPSLDGAILFASYWSDGLAAYDIESGEKIWHIKGGRYRSVIVYDEHIVTVCYAKSIKKIDIHSGNTLAEIKSTTIERQFELEDGNILVDSISGKVSLVAQDLSVIRQYKKKVVNPFDCLSQVIREAYLKDGDIYISGFEEYSNRSIKNSGSRTFERKLE